MLPTEVSTEIKPIDAKTIPGTATAHFRDEKKPLNHRISRNEDPTGGIYNMRLQFRVPQDTRIHRSGLRSIHSQMLY